MYLMVNLLFLGLILEANMEVMVQLVLQLERWNFEFTKRLVGRNTARDFIKDGCRMATI